MTDHITRVREQATRYAEEQIGGYIAQAWYVQGQVDLASRLTRENIAEALMQACHDPYFEGLVFAELREREARRFYEQADAVLELIGRR